MPKNPRGSKWHKWDLHVHTPYSHAANYGSPENADVWEKFVLDLENLPKEIRVLGINDYYFLDGYKRLLQDKNARGRLKNIDLLLPVVELRLRNFSGSNELRKINFHVIFSNELPVATIEQYFVSQLELEYLKTGQNNWKRHLSRETLQEFGQKIFDDAPAEEKHKFRDTFSTGASNATFDLDRIKGLLDHDSFRDLFLTAIGKAEWSSHSWTQAIADKKRLINSADIVFTASTSIEDCISSQKAGDRIFIGEIPEKLRLVNEKPTKFITKLEIQKKSGSGLAETWFQHEIPLNYDLVAIVGNKGSGKSALADIIGLLGNSHHHEHFSFLSESRFRDPRIKKASHFVGTLTWASGADTPKLLDQDPDVFDFEKVKYIPQSYLEKICNEVSNGKETEFEVLENCMHHGVGIENGAFSAMIFEKSKLTLSAAVLSAAIKISYSSTAIFILQRATANGSSPRKGPTPKY